MFSISSSPKRVGTGRGRAVKSPGAGGNPGMWCSWGLRLALGRAPACPRQRGLCLSLRLTRGLYSPWGRWRTHLQTGFLWASLSSLLSTRGADPSEGSCQGCAKTRPWRCGLSAADSSWRVGGGAHGHSEILAILWLIDLPLRSHGHLLQVYLRGPPSACVAGSKLPILIRTPVTIFTWLSL